MEMPEDGERMACGRTGLEIFVQLVALIRAYLCHRAMVKHPGECAPFGGAFPVLGRLNAQQMKERIVSGGDCTSKTGLFRSLGFAIGKVMRLLKQVVRKRHLGSFPKGFSQQRLFGAASEVEIRLKSKLLGLDLVQNLGDDPPG